MSDHAQRVKRQNEILLRWLPYGLAAVSLALAAATAPTLDRIGSLPVIVVLALVLITSHWYVVDRRWGTPLDDRLGRVYIIGRTALAFAITWINPFFAIFAFIGFLDAHTYLPRRGRIVIVLVTAVTMAGSQSGGMPLSSAVQGAVFAGLFLVNVGLVQFLYHLTSNEAALIAERDETIAELERTNTRLAAALAENEDLNTRLVQQAHLAGVHEERERLALEIHDTIAQNLIGIITQLDAAMQAGDPNMVQRHHDRAALMARDALSEARRSVQDLFPHQLTNASLPEALQYLVDDWSALTGVNAQLVVDGAAEPLHLDVETTILRVAQEALANISRHAKANRVGVTLAYMGDVVSLDVRDDGVGFKVGSPGTGARQLGHNGRSGSGLTGMRYRATRVAGRIVVESEPGSGTAICLQIPAVPGSATVKSYQEPGVPGV